jgi:pilus assembly protein Flp/PilA
MKRLNQRGQGMTEYILIVALIAIAVIGAVKYFGKSTNDSFKNSANAVSGAVNNGIADGQK